MYARARAHAGQHHRSEACVQKDMFLYVFVLCVYVDAIILCDYMCIKETRNHETLQTQVLRHVKLKHLHA